MVEANASRAAGWARLSGNDDEPDARTEVLRRIRSALAEEPPRRSHGTPTWNPSSATLPQLAGDALIDHFSERVSEYRATVLRATESSVPAVVAEVFASWNARRIVVPAGFPGAWLVTTSIEPILDDPLLTRDALDAVDGVVTTCALGIAESGTIVLDAGPGQGRRALSLLPDRHLCVIRSQQIVQDVPDAIARLDPRRPLTWISGPSATSDIELQRVEGVHGPRTLTVVLVEPS
jgi:L-lactate dehydrogenase complex protein LldG